MNSVDRFEPEVIDAIRNAIREADGQEVLFVGKVDQDGVVVSIAIAARGNEGAVPALMPHMEKGDVVIHNHPSGGLRPSDPDLSVASRLGNLGIGFFIVDNLVDRVYVVAEPHILRELVPLDSEELVDALGPHGPLSRFIDEYEARDSQLLMVEAVAECFNSGSICVAEAGTGVGKSMAYLVPALRWVEQNEERVVISTATINLQQQLVDKDIPLALKILGSKVKTALVKGRGNYICLRKMSEAVEEDSLFQESDDELKAIVDWADTTKSGSRSDLPTYVNDQAWQRVAAEADGCLGLRCRFREKCFVLKARREAAAAQLLVVNHHLLFSDLSLRISGAGFDNTAVLPPFQRLIFDEAHNMERSATSYFSETLNRFSLGKQLWRLHRRRRGRVFGLAVSMRRFFRSGGRGGDLLEQLPDKCTAVRERAEAFDALLVAGLAPESSRRYTQATGAEERGSLLAPLGELHDALLALILHLQAILEEVSDADLESAEAYEARVVRQRLEDFASICQTFSQYDEIADKVFWAERLATAGGEVFGQLVITPLDLSGLMREAVFEPYESVVCTSATLTVRGDFTFWLSRVGLAGFDRRSVSSALFPSPFPYRERVLLGVPNDAPEPTNEMEHRQFVADFSVRAIEISEGHALVLFTSYSMLKAVYEEAAPRLAQLGITSFKQGDDDRGRLLSRFTADVSSVLFATDSFWEGVDAPGDTLKLVILCRLPFRVPTDPVVAARMEAIEKAGGNSFYDYSLPNAVMKLKQGFGRLMRRSTDQGAVLILDPRIVRKSYGPLFLESLPETMLSLKAGSSVLADLENFLYR
ncbi:MAG TPA: helicase C-terminal domain-containing protein [Spirochaetia bacterium]|nr:helicase C-terminal domain-containing protein [Spirochaetia bacterium]